MTYCHLASTLRDIAVWVSMHDSLTEMIHSLTDLRHGKTA